MKAVCLTALVIGFTTVLGTLFGLLIRKIPQRSNDTILGAAAGVMLGAAILGLILPAVETSGTFALPLTVAGVLSGALLISFLDKFTPHLHHLAGIDQEKHANSGSTGKILLFVFAIAIHKLPEGFASGVSFGTKDIGDVLTVAGSISIQNIPEAMVIVYPLLSIGVSVLRTILISLIIGLVSMTGTLLGFVLVSFSEPVLPFMLAFAGGTMLYVISDEMIPETHAHGFEKQATFALIIGFLVILIMQRVLS